jgi:hypothetical protein
MSEEDKAEFEAEMKALLEAEQNVHQMGEFLLKRNELIRLKEGLVHYLD